MLEETAIQGRDQQGRDQENKAKMTQADLHAFSYTEKGPRQRQRVLR